VTGIQRKNYSKDPSKSIVLEAFALEKTVRGEGGREERREGGREGGELDGDKEPQGLGERPRVRELSLSNERENNSPTMRQDKHTKTI
jgi:hypothetical protein